MSSHIETNLSEEEIHRKIGLIFSKTERIINELTTFRQKQVQSVNNHLETTSHVNFLTINNVVNLAIPAKQNTYLTSIGCQTQRIQARDYEKQDYQNQCSAEFGNQGNSITLTINPECYERQIQQNWPKQKCQNTLKTSTDFTPLKRSRSKGISVVSLQSCVTSKKSQNRNREGQKIMLIRNNFKDRKKLIIN